MCPFSIAFAIFNNRRLSDLSPKPYGRTFFVFAWHTDETQVRFVFFTQYGRTGGHRNLEMKYFYSGDANIFRAMEYNGRVTTKVCYMDILAEVY